MTASAVGSPSPVAFGRDSDPLTHEMIRYTEETVFKGQVKRPQSHTPNYLMSHPAITPLSTKVPLQLGRLVSKVFAVQKSQKDGEEKKRLADGEPLVPKSLPLLSPPPQAKVMSSPASELDDVTLLRGYAGVARQRLLALPTPCPLLSFRDVEFLDGHPIAAGGFTDIRKAKHDGCEVALKVYRCCRSFDITQVSAVCCDCRHRTSY